MEVPGTDSVPGTYPAEPDRTEGEKHCKREDVDANQSQEAHDS